MTCTLTMRPATAEDLGTLDRVFQHSYIALLKHDYAPSQRVSAVPGIGRAQPHLIRSGRFFAAESGGAGG